jgi:putative exosortase-associated protein (TIGR04073 family)
MKKGMLLLLIALSLTFAPVMPTAFAQEGVWEMAQSEHYGRKAGGMFGRGLINVATSFMDIIVQTVEGTKSGPPFVGSITGLGGGIACSALRVSSGALDVLTFWVPGFNGIPVGRSYANCLEFEEETPTYAAQPSYAAPVSNDEAAPTTVVQRHDPMDYVKK